MLHTRTLQVGGSQAKLLRLWERPTKRPLIVAVSGGIGSGKSTFARALQPVVGTYADADQLAREVVMPGALGLRMLQEHFGGKILCEDGSLNRQYLANLIFNDPAKRAVVEHIMHPLIEQRAREILTSAPSGSIALYDVPLIRSEQEATAFDVVIVVAAPLDERISRLVARGLPREDAQRRIDAQINDNARRELASIWVDNAGSRKDLEALAGAVATTWLLPTCR